MFRTLATLAVAAAFSAAGRVTAADPSTSGNQVLAGIDHLPTVVADLERASTTYRQLGFALKPGRPHDNGLRNLHLKFPDGSGIELLTVPAVPADRLTRRYTELLQGGEGPAYLSLHVRDSAALIAVLDAAAIDHDSGDGLLTLADPQLGFLFIVRDNRSPTDLPEHFAHANGAVAMSEVWLALDPAALDRLSALMRALGASASRATVDAPTPTPATIFDLQNGRLIVVAGDRQRIPGRPIIGAAFRVDSAAHDDRVLTPRLIEPAAAHGLWLLLRPGD